MSGRLKPNPRFAAIRDRLRRHPDWFGPWRGTLFRFQTVDYPVPKDILSGEGARLHGGRWNPPGIATIYGSTTDTTALEECKANDRYYGVITKDARLVVAIEADLEYVLDLTQAQVRRGLGITLKELAAEDWRKLLAAGKESLTQAIGRAVETVGASGLVARSAAVRSGINGVVFPGARSGDRLTVVDATKLSKLRGKPKV